MVSNSGKVYFIGAGPGDPELITVKGRRLLESAGVVIYAGSLVNPEVFAGTRAAVHDSSGKTLDEIMDLISSSCQKGETVVRLHTGDTSFYSAISEQIERLRILDIPYEVVPGVSSAMAGAAALGQELTIPEISQTVIFTRIEGRTPVPEKEKLSDLAKINASMVIFLSVGMIEKVRDQLLKGYTEDTPVIVMERVSWPGERIIRSTLGGVVEKVKEAGITKTALIYIGESLKASESQLRKESKLYHKDFKHGYRK
jgi:precorrin-4/cobalt-precorrin-4 C11-methyltransferase